MKSRKACLACKPFSRSPLSIMYFHASLVALSMSLKPACNDTWTSAACMFSSQSCRHHAKHADGLLTNLRHQRTNERNHGPCSQTYEEGLQARPVAKACQGYSLQNNPTLESSNSATYAVHELAAAIAGATNVFSLAANVIWYCKPHPCNLQPVKRFHFQYQSASSLLDGECSIHGWGQGHLCG